MIDAKCSDDNDDGGGAEVGGNLVQCGSDSCGGRLFAGVLSAVGR